MSRKSRAVPALEPKRCALCEGLLSERRPVFLLTDNTGVVRGPLHAGCAEKLKIEAEKRGDEPFRSFNSFGQIVRLYRQETLPW